MKKLIEDLYNQLFKQGSCGRRNFRLYLRHFTHYKQRLINGYDDSETYSLFTTNSQWLVPRLERFITIKKGHPGDISDEEWNDILNKILKAHKIIAQDDYSSEDIKIVKEGLKLYAEWYQHLWW